MPAALTAAEARTRSGLLDVESYAVFLDLAGDAGTVRSRAEIRFRCRQPGAQTFADVTAATVSRVTLNSEELDPAAVSDGRLPLPPLPTDNVLVVETEYGRPRSGHGLSWFTDPAGGARYVLGMCFPTLAPGVFCCFDQPDLRADLTLTIAAPAGWDCVSNGAVTARPAPGEAGLWEFATVPAMKPYDLALCAGPYATVSEEEHQGSGGTVALSLRSRPRLTTSPGLAQVASIVRRTLAFYEQFLGVPCPYGKYDVLFTPDLRAIGVCLPGVMMISETTLERMAGPGDDLIPAVLAHEVAHLWFGCLVEGRWWDDLWLAEALATYLSYLACAQALGLDEPWAGFAARDQVAACQADSLPGTQPVSSPVATADDAMSRPAVITYMKGASVIRQLAALIGDEALRAGLSDYLTRYGGTTATLADLIGCWSTASGRDLGGWADEWLRSPGVNVLRPEVTLTHAGAIGSFAVVQEPSSQPAAPPGAPAPGAKPGQQGPQGPPGPLRTHKLVIGAYQQVGDQLRQVHRAEAELSGARTTVPGLAGLPAPDAFVLNAGGHAFARIRFDGRSLGALAACAMDVSDPVTEAVCWNAAWDMTVSGELPVSEFIALASRRLADAGPHAEPGELLQRAVTAADRYAPPGHRRHLRQRLADAALAGARRAVPGSRGQRGLATGFAASADTGGQLDLLRSWLAGRSLPGGVTAGVALRGQILMTLAARGLAREADLAACAADDPAGGEALLATCRGLFPTAEAKQAAWEGALASGQPPQLAVAHARGIWVPGQDDLLIGYRDRYFTQALPAAACHDPFNARRLATLLYPATLVHDATFAATDEALARDDLGDVLRGVLLDQRAILTQVRASRAAARG